MYHRIYSLNKNNPISISRFSHIINEKKYVTLNCFAQLNLILNEQHLNSFNKEFIMDIFPVEIGKLYRESQLNLCNNYGVKLKGFNASKKSYFLGFKITLLTNLAFFSSKIVESIILIIFLAIILFSLLKAKNKCFISGDTVNKLLIKVE